MYMVDTYDRMENAFQKKIAGDGLSAEKIANYRKPFRRLDEFASEREGLISRIEALDAENKELKRVTQEQQAFIEKLKRAIRNPAYGLKWAIDKKMKGSEQE